MQIIPYLLVRDAKQAQAFNPNCLSRSGVQNHTRGTLFDWMLKVTTYLHMRTETLHMATTFVDQFMSRRKIDSNQYQLVGVTALFLAGKVHERVAVSLNKLSYLTEYSFTPKQIIEMELKMLRAFDYDVNPVLPHTFMETALVACEEELTEDQCSMINLICLYLFDLSLTEIDLAPFSASLRAAGAVFLARRLIFSSTQGSPKSPDSAYGGDVPEMANLWTSKLTAHTGHDAYNDARVKKVALIYASALAKVQLAFRDEADESEEMPSVSAPC